MLREKSYNLVGTNALDRYKADMGAVMFSLEMQDGLEEYAREIGRVESRLLWAEKQGMEVPPYILKALRESIDLYIEREAHKASEAGARP